MSSSLLGLLLGTLSIPAATAHASTPGHDRSIWFWQSPDSPFGSLAILGNAAREDAAIARLKAWGVTTVYGSYSGSETPAVLRAWNRKLNSNGISSYLLMADTEDLFPESWTAASARLKANFVQFNRDSSPSERFGGVAFDIEPHIFPGSARHGGWKASEPLIRRQYMADLLQFFQRTRALLDENGEVGAHIEGTLPVWFAKLSGSIQWNDAIDRDGWFAQLSKACDRISLMAFEVPSPATIVQRSDEEGNLLHGKARIALRANLGNEWHSLKDFWAAAHAVEEETHQSIDIQDFARLASESEADKSATEVPAAQ